MLFGWMNAPATFQRMMDEILKGLMYSRAYLDNIVIFFKSEKEHLEDLMEVLKKKPQATLRIYPKKCTLGHSKVHLLSRIVSTEGISVDSEKPKRS